MINFRIIVYMHILSIIYYIYSFLSIYNKIQAYYYLNNIINYIYIYTHIYYIHTYILYISLP